MASDRDQSRLMIPMSEDIPDYRIKPIARVIYSNAFELFIVAVIVLNAVVLSILTFDNVPETWVRAFERFDTYVIWIFVAELALRIISFGKRPWEFLKTGWNLFDLFVIILIPFTSSATLIRLLRLFRVIRLLRFMPDFRMLSISLAKSLRPLLSLTVLIAFIMFIYAMAGVYLFGEQTPEQWGDLGVAMSTMTVLLTLENFPDYVATGLESTGFAWVFFISYMFIVVFTVLNVLIGIVLTAMDEAREEIKESVPDSQEVTKKLIEAVEANQLSPAQLKALQQALSKRDL